MIADEITYDLNPESYELGLSDQINITSNSKLDKIFNQFIDNDLFIYGNFAKIPKFWFCRWYNDSRIKGYNRGDFFWVNTADINTFLNDNAKQIQAYANANPFIINKLPDWNQNNGNIVNLYLDVLSGYSENSMLAAPLPALWELGNLSGSSQLYVSLVDNNKKPLLDENYWKPFLVSEIDKDGRSTLEYIEQIFLTKSDAVLNDHVKNYHFGGVPPTSAEINMLSSGYVNADFSNIDETFSQNYLENGNESNKFDIIDVYVKKPYPNRVISGEVSEYTWFRKWKSGYLEHGGIINIDNYISPDKTKIIIPFNWDFISDGAEAYDIKYLSVPNSKTKKDEIVSVDVEIDNPETNLDNIISVLFQLDKETFKIYDKSYAPVYYKNDYFVKICPINVTNDTNQSDYLNMGKHSLNNNTINDSLMSFSDLSVAGFSFKNIPESTTKYYSYYIGGYSLNAN